MNNSAASQVLSAVSDLSQPQKNLLSLFSSRKTSTRNLNSSFSPFKNSLCGTRKNPSNLDQCLSKAADRLGETKKAAFD
jgi:hypothetical protein